MPLPSSLLASMPDSTVIVTEIVIYPVKSLRGISLDSAELSALGLADDRRWMIVDAGGRFVTQRELPAMARVSTGLVEGDLELSMEGKGSVRVSSAPAEADVISTRVWKDRCETVDQGDEVSQWLTQALESRRPLRLVAMKKGFVRALRRWDKLGETTSTQFADAAPFLVTHQGSLDALNAELVSRKLSPVPMNRFRPNVVISGLEPFQEHRIRRLEHAGYGFSLRYPCERCVVTTIDQKTGLKDPEKQPFRTLAGINPMPGNPRAPAFGQNAILSRGQGNRISVGDRLSFE